MKRHVLFILIFFLAFSIQFKLINGLGTGQPKFYDTSPPLTEEVPSPEIQVSQTINQQIISQFSLLVIQFFLLVLIFVLITLIFQKIISKKPKLKKKR
jgi:hypothetical protein